MATAYTKRLDRGIPSQQRYQYYDGITDATELTVNVKSDLGHNAKTGFIINNSTTNGIVLYFNDDEDPSGSMAGIPMTASDKFSFSVLELNVSSIKITGTSISVDIYVS